MTMLVQAHPLVRLSPEQQHLTLLAYAVLALDRPGWLGAIRGAANEFANGGRLFEELYAANRDRWDDERWGPQLPRATPTIEDVTRRLMAR